MAQNQSYISPQTEQDLAAIRQALNGKVYAGDFDRNGQTESLIAYPKLPVEAMLTFTDGNYNIDSALKKVVDDAGSAKEMKAIDAARDSFKSSVVREGQGFIDYAAQNNIDIKKLLSTYGLNEHDDKVTPEKVGSMLLATAMLTSQPGDSNHQVVSEFTNNYLVIGTAYNINRPFPVTKLVAEEIYSDNFAPTPGKTPENFIKAVKATGQLPQLR
jgi:hypothetical protein